MLKELLGQFLSCGLGHRAFQGCFAGIDLKRRGVVLYDPVGGTDDEVASLLNVLKYASFVGPAVFSMPCLFCLRSIKKCRVDICK